MRRIDWDNWNGETLLDAVMERDRRFPEFEYCLLPDGSQVPHDNPWHLETLLEHTCWVVETARKLSAEYRLSPRSHAVVMVAATWHDAGKPFVRLPKERFICGTCGRPRHEDDGCPCGGTLERRTVMGYHDHETVGASDWIFGNICRRERIPGDIKYEARGIIKDHLWFADRIVSGSPPRRTTLNRVLVSWADEVSRKKAEFDGVDLGPIFREVADGLKRR